MDDGTRWEWNQTNDAHKYCIGIPQGNSNTMHQLQGRKHKNKNLEDCQEWHQVK